MVAALTGYLMAAQQNARELYQVGLASVPFLLAVGDLLIGWLLLQQAEIALEALDGDPADRRPCLLRRQGRGGKVLREERAAAADRRTPERRGGRSVADGDARGVLLEASG